MDGGTIWGHPSGRIPAQSCVSFVDALSRRAGFKRTLRSLLPGIW